MLAFALAVGIYGRWLVYERVPETPGQDLAKHVAMALNFAAAVDDGQMPPRLQINHPTKPDIPIFQYYGFMTGMAAYPFLKCGLPGLQAVAASLVLLRILGLLCLYAATRRFGLPQPAAWLAMALFALEPYSISNLYGRVAVSEFHAHSLLPATLWGYALLQTGRIRFGFAVITASCGLLALTHNIFFLYGSAFFALLISASSLSFRIRLYAAFALLTAGLITSWQWLPAFLSAPDLSINFYKTDPYYNGYLTDGRGLLGLLRPLGEHGGETRYFFTYSCWTLIGLIGVFVFLPVQRARISLCLAGIFTLVVSLGWCDIWSYLPHFTYALQFPYRLIPFVGMIGALGTAALLARYCPPAGLVIFGVAAALSIRPVFKAPAFDHYIDKADDALMRDFASSDYIATDQRLINQASHIVASDLWLRDDNIIRGDGHAPITVTLRGRSILGNRPIYLRLTSTDDIVIPISDAVAILPGTHLQTVTLEAKRFDRTARIVPSEFLIPAVVDHNIAGDRRRLSVAVDSMLVNDRPIVGLDQARLISRSGLRRTFNPQPAVHRLSGNEFEANIGLPTAYTRFLEARQDGVRLPVSSAADGTALVHTISLAPIDTEYRLPPMTLALSLLGFVAFVSGVSLIKDVTSV